MADEKISASPAATDLVSAEFAGIQGGDNKRFAIATFETHFNTLYQPLDADLTAIAALTTTAGGRGLLTLSDPNADRIVFWDDSAGAFAHLTPSTGLTVSTTTLTVDTNEYLSLAPSAAQNNYATGASTSATIISTINIAPTVSCVISGISTTSFETGKRLLIRNSTSNTGSTGRCIILPRNSSSSTAGNRFQYPGNKRLPLILMPGEVAEFVFDGTDLELIRTTRSQNLSGFFDYHVNGMFSGGAYTSGTSASSSYENVATDSSSEPYLYINIDTGTTATGYAFQVENSNAQRAGAGCLLFMARAAVPVLSNATDEFDAFVGFTDAASAPADQICWWYDRNTGTNWRTRTVSNSTVTSNDGGIAVATTATPILGCFVNGDGTRVEFFYSNDMGTTWVFTSTAHTTNIPNTTARTFGFGGGIVKSAGTTEVSLRILWAGSLGWL